MTLSACVPKDKHDAAALRRARLAGFPKLNPLLPELLIWLQDMNWPVAEGVADLLSTSGVEIAPHIRAVFSSDDAIWKYWILTRLCPRLSPAVLAELSADIASLAANPSPADRSEDVHEAAKALAPTLRAD